MREEKPKAILLSEYAAPDFLIDRVELDFFLGETETQVRSRLHMRRNPLSKNMQAPLVLDGAELELCSLILSERELGEADYRLTEKL